MLTKTRDKNDGDRVKITEVLSTCILTMKPHLSQLQDQQWKILLEQLFGSRH